jgi:cytochrome c-type biogenesis protein
MEVGHLGAFGAGLLSFLSPCVLPLVPPYLCFLAGVSMDDLHRGSNLGRSTLVLGRALAFVLGFGIVFVGLGAGASGLGRLLSEHLTLLTRIAGVVIVVFGLHMLGAFRSLALLRDARFQVTRRPAGSLGAFVVGLAFAFGWSPCVGPVLASILLVAGAEAEPWQGAALLGVYAAGLGVPFLLAALFSRPFLAWLASFRRHLGAIEKTMGGALVITGLLIFTGTMPVLAGWLLDLAPALGRIG